MSQQQQSEQPPQQPQQPNWFVALIVTVIVSGIVQVLVNHFDGIAAAIVGLFSQIHVPPLQGTPTFVVLNILSGIATILSGGSAIILFSLNHQRQRHQRLMTEHLRLVVKSTQQLEEQLAKQQRKKRKTV